MYRICNSRVAQIYTQANEHIYRQVVLFFLFFFKRLGWWLDNLKYKIASFDTSLLIEDKSKNLKLPKEMVFMA